MADTPGKELSSINFESMLGGPLMAVVNAQAQAAMSTVNFIKSVGFKPGANADPLNPDTSEPIYVSFKYPKEVSPYQPPTPAAITDVTINTGGGGSGYTSEPSIAFTGGGGSGAKAKAIVTNGVVTSIILEDPGAGYTSAPTVSFSGGGGTGAAATAGFRAAAPAVPATYASMQIEVPILTLLPIPFIRIEETTIDFNAKINSVEETTTDSTFKTAASASGTVKYPPLFAVASVKLKVSTSYQKNTQSGSKVDRTYSMAVHIRAVQDEMPAGMEKILGILEDAIVALPTSAPPPVRV